MIQYYDAVLQKLKHPQEHKIRRIIELDRLECIHKDFFMCNPIAGYNSTAYRLTRNEHGGFNCTCQGFRKRHSCSHSTALGIILSDKEGEKQGVLF